MKPEDVKVLNFDHLTFWVGNAKTASSYFVTRFGFTPLAVKEASEDNPRLSYAVRLNKITIAFESPTKSHGEIAKDLEAHGDFVKDVAFEVNDLHELVKRSKKEGAVIVKDVTVEKDDHGTIKYAVLRTYGDNTHTLIDRSDYNGVFLPGYTAMEDDPMNKLLPDTNLTFIDHVEGNIGDGTLSDSVSWYERNLNMHKFWCVDYSHDLVPYSCINSASVINQNETVLLSMNEAAKGLRPSSKVTEFVKSLGTSGVEHVALYTDDIVNTIRSLKARGAEILTWPPKYYEMIKDKLKSSSLNVKETIEELEQENILIDFDEKGYMLQAFTKHLQARPTVFIEIIQRRNHKGFGAMNYKWVFEAIEQLGDTDVEKSTKE
ncbi:4-hydroxyphenylpyruvate dioxygenase-like [Leptidea sinapis]|uniref:4-hydroxyphenylpyruvate dioxygenase-like n=1 Tax=Leptidea sinapis TaxID=189913 RepID=UPI0021216093|nr:4-hydroxyphenylpyruvate dioxygenase-like [Leptidea sinapis]